MAFALAGGGVADTVERAAFGAGNADLGAVITEVLAVFAIAFAFVAESVAAAVLGTAEVDLLREGAAVSANIALIAVAFAVLADTAAAALSGAGLDVAGGAVPTLVTGADSVETHTVARAGEGVSLCV